MATKSDLRKVTPIFFFAGHFFLFLSRCFLFLSIYNIFVAHWILFFVKCNAKDEKCICLWLFRAKRGRSIPRLAVAVTATKSLRLRLRLRLNPKPQRIFNFFEIYAKDVQTLEIALEMWLWSLEVLFKDKTLQKICFSKEFCTFLHFLQCKFT